MPPSKLADGTGVPNGRAQSACIKAIDAYQQVIQTAERLEHLVGDLEREAGSSSGIIRLPLEDGASKPIR